MTTKIPMKNPERFDEVHQYFIDNKTWDTAWAALGFCDETEPPQLPGAWLRDLKRTMKYFDSREEAEAWLSTLTMEERRRRCDPSFSAKKEYRSRFD